MAHKLADFPDVVREAATLREPHRIVFYVQELARDFQSYFTRLKGESDPILPPDERAREAGWEARGTSARRARASRGSRPSAASYAAALELVGVSAPERMDRPVDEVEAAAAADSTRRVARELGRAEARYLHAGGRAT